MYHSLSVDCPRTRESEAASSNCLSTKAPNKPLGMLSLLLKVHHLPRKVSPKDNFKCQSGEHHFHTTRSLAKQTNIVDHTFPPVTISHPQKGAHKKHGLQSGAIGPLTHRALGGHNTSAQTQTTVDVP